MVAVPPLAIGAGSFAAQSASCLAVGGRSHRGLACTGLLSGSGRCRPVGRQGLPPRGVGVALENCGREMLAASVSLMIRDAFATSCQTPPPHSERDIGPIISYIRHGYAKD
jgi:hypothetical protein